MGTNFHPECFACAYCNKIFANSPFYLEDGLPYCEEDWNELFTTKCISCGFPIEAGDRWVEALNNNYHSQCFNCSLCKKNLEGQSFFVKSGKPFCKSHARGWKNCTPSETLRIILHGNIIYFNIVAFSSLQTWAFTYLLQHHQHWQCVYYKLFCPFILLITLAT